MQNDQFVWPETPFTQHTQNGFSFLEPFSGDSVNAFIFVWEPFLSNSFTFFSEMVLEPFSLQCE